MNVFMNHPAF